MGREIRTRLGTLDEAEMNRRAADMISALGVNIKAETVVEKLTIAQQQMVEIVKAVSFNGKIIVMDDLHHLFQMKRWSSYLELLRI